MSRRPLALVLSNDVPDSDYGARHLAAAFEAAFDTGIVEPLDGVAAVRARLSEGRVQALVLSGSDRSVNLSLQWMQEEQDLLRDAVAARVPTLAVCFGHQLLGVAFGAGVVTRNKRTGLFDIELIGRDPLFDGLGPRAVVPEQHRDQLDRLPKGFELTATSDYCRIQAMRHESAPVYGVQFHPCYGDDVFDADDEWAATPLRGRFAHDGGRVLSNAVALFRKLVG